MRWTRALGLGRAAEGAALGLLAWVAATELGLPRLAGLLGASTFAWAALAGAAVGRWRLGAVRGTAAAVALLYAVVAYAPVSRALLPSVVRRDAAGARPAVDAVAVFSSDVGPDGRLRKTGLERLLAGVTWARALDRPLLVSAVRQAEPGAASSEADQRALAALAGVRRVAFVDSVHVTRDEALRMAARARREGWARLLVVTSPSHSRRACAALERAGVAVTCVPSASREYVLDGPDAVRGPAERVAAFRDWCYEAVGWAVYRARGWV